ncbi:MAG: PD40 domain-containing protein [Flavobacteriales bacterium]|nr:PD40 domain-containing protein [Flavobacteriales bacterium]
MEKILKGPVEVRNVIISEAGRKCADPEYRSFRSVAILLILLLPNLLLAQGDVQLRAKADALFEAEKFAEAMPMYSQLVSLEPSDRTLNYLFGTCILFGGADKEKAIGHLKYATDFPAIPTMAWYWLGRAYHLNYRFKDAQTAYQRFVGTGDRKALEKWPVEALQQQCRNGEKLLSNLKEIKVRNKVEVNDVDFFRFYDLSDIGGKIVVMPEELKTSYDKKKELRSLVYLPDRGGTFYFGSYGKDGKTGLDIYRSELVNGSYASPVKLAGYINTDQDEDFAFLHPDGKTFYFSSKGHSSMGGYDVFRASFDKGLDAFGRPENMDFAVNTPDDDIFYIVDPEQKEACFASARSSSQGNLHVYRVATEQLKLNLTVLKGTFANGFDASDRKAHIVVVDDLTRETVIDVQTDINGSYIISLPRSGRFRYQVDCGPTGRKHVGIVDVPANDSPRAYRQEIELVNKSGAEELVIRNYFDSPLDGDIIELALDEIKRRARLDVVKPQEIAVVPTPEVIGDVMTAAGFTGDIDKAAAVRLAQNDAAEEEMKANEMLSDSKEAFGIAISSVNDAEKAAARAEQLLTEANAASSEESKNKLMTDAARERQHARDAHMRARAAQRTGLDLETESAAARQRGIAATKRSNDVQQALNANNDKAALPLLIALRKHLEEKAGPGGEKDFVELQRRAATAKKEEGDRAMSQANSKSLDETELKNRLARAKREVVEARGSKKETLEKEIAEYQTQLGYLHDETEAAFAKADVLNRETKVMKGQVMLTKKLATTSSGNKADPDKNDVASLGQRIGGIGTRIANIEVDERYDPELSTNEAEVEARMFDWNGSYAATASNGITATRAAERESVTERVDTRKNEVAGEELTQETSPDTDVADVPTGQGKPDEDTTASALPSVRLASVGENSNGTNDQIAGKTNNTDGTGTKDPATTSDQDRTRVSSADPSVVPSTTSEKTASTPEELSPEEIRNAGENDALVVMNTEAPSELDAATKRFVLENELAELRQIEKAEKDAGKKQEIAQRMAELDVLLNAPVPEPEEANAEIATDEDLRPTAADMERVPMTFDPGIKDSLLITDLYSDYSKDKARILKMDDPIDRADGLNGLELMLADSLRGEMVRQLAVLQLDSSQAGTILPRISRLSKMREERIETGAQYAAVAQQVAEAQPEEPGMNSIQLSEVIGSQEEKEPETAKARHPILDRFISVDPDPKNVYASDLAHRADGLDNALAFKTADLARIDGIQGELDSLNNLLMGHARDKEYDKLIKEMSQLHDERYIIRTDLGQRSAFLTKSEFTEAKDSVKTLEAVVKSKALLVDEPLWVMAKALRSDADMQFEQAAEMRKQADRINDIFERDSLYRTAYGSELEGLRSIDEAITVNNYILSDEFKEGEQLEYVTVASRVLGIPEPVAERSEEIAANSEQEQDSGTDVAITDLNTMDPVRNDTTDQAEDQIAQATGTPDTDTISDPAASLTEGSTEAEQNNELISEVVEDNVDPVQSNEPIDQVAELVPVPVPASGTVTDNVDQVVIPIEAEDLISEPATTSVIDTSASETVAETLDRDPTSTDPIVADTPPANNESTSEEASATLEENGSEPSITAPAVNTTGDPIVLNNDPTAATSEGSSAKTVLTTEGTIVPAAEDRADAIAERIIGEQPTDRRRPIEYYASFLQVEDISDPSVFPEPTIKDPDRLQVMAESAVREAIDLERSSLEKAELAAVNLTEASTAKKRDKAELEILAVRNTALSDSLHTASVQRDREARMLDIQLQQMKQSELFRERMLRYYYMTPEELTMIEARSDQNLYFQARAKAQDQQNAADEAARNAQADRVAGESLRAEAIRVGENAGGSVSADEAAQTAGLLQLRAGRMMARADSLGDVAERLRIAALNSNNKASMVMQTMQTDLATETVALETRTSVVNDPIADLVSPSTTVADPSPVPTPAPAPAPTPVSDPSPAIAGTIPAVLKEDVFDIRSTPVVRTEAIPIDAAIPEGIVFKVQIGAFKSGISKDAFSELTPITGETVGNGFVRYTAGMFTGFEGAAKAKDLVRERGYGDAFVVAYQDGKRIPLGDAMRQTGAAGVEPASAAITTAPASTTPTPTVVTPAPATSTTVPAATTVPVTTPPANTDEAILATYPATAEEVLASYTPPVDATAYYNEPGAAPAKQVETVKGLFFTVQVGVYSKPVALDRIFNIEPLNSERTATGKIRYTTGMFLDTDAARTRKDVTVTLGVSDAYVTAYINGKRIPLSEANALLAKFGTSILAQP